MKNSRLLKILNIYLHLFLFSFGFTYTINKLATPSIAEDDEKLSVIKGTTYIPSDYIPAQRFCAKDIETREQYCTETEDEQQNFELKIPPGSYIVFSSQCSAYDDQYNNCLSFESTNVMGEPFIGYFTEASECNFTVGCYDKNSVKPVVISLDKGEVVSGIKIDWYRKISASAIPKPSTQSNSVRESNVRAEQLVKNTELRLYSPSDEEKNAAISDLEEALSLYQSNIDSSKNLFFAKQTAEKLCKGLNSVANFGKKEEYCNLYLELSNKLRKKDSETVTYEAYRSLSNMHREIGDYSKAISLMQQAREKHLIEVSSFELRKAGGQIDVSGSQKGLEKQRISFSTNIAELFFISKDYDSATKHYREARNALIELEGEDRDLNEQALASSYPLKESIDLAYSLLRQGNLSEAKATFEEAHKISKDTEGLHYKNQNITDEEYLNQIAEREKSQFGTVSFGTTENEKLQIEPSLYDGLKELYIEEKNYQKALEVAEEEKQGALSILLSSQAGKEVSRFSSLETPGINEIKQIAQQNNSTIVYYSKLLEDKIAIWVINPEGEIGFHQVTLDSPSTENKVDINANDGKYKLLIGTTLSIAIIALTISRATNKEKFLLFSLLLLTLTACDRFPDEPEEIKSSYSFSTVEVPGSSFLSSTVQSTITEARGGSDRNNKLAQSNLNCQEQDTCLKDLYQVLIEPIERFLPKDPEQKIIFIPDAELHTVPFAALQDSEDRYLIDKHTINRVSSLQLLQSLSLIANNKPNSSEATEALIVGNPIMPEVTIADSVEGTQQDLSPLPGTEKEAKAIAKLLGTTPILGKEATETAVANKISESKIVHFATHGVLNAKLNTPECSEITGLNDNAPQTFVDTCLKKRSGIDILTFTPSNEDDGLLDVSEIYDLDLNADLVVMSACETGLGTISNEGVIGLARPFLASGVPSVVASLWSVPDNPTAELMTEFYQNLESEADKTKALRKAMLAIRDRYPEPSNWAGFTLIGKGI